MMSFSSNLLYILQHWRWMYSKKLLLKYFYPTYSLPYYLIYHGEFIQPKCIIHLYCYGVRDELVNTCMGSLQTKCFRPCIRMMFWGIRQFIFGSRIFPICITFNWWLFFNVTLVDLSLLVCVTDRSILTVPFFF